MAKGVPVRFEFGGATGGGNDSAGTTDATLLRIKAGDTYTNSLLTSTGILFGTAGSAAGMEFLTSASGSGTGFLLATSSNTLRLYSRDNSAVPSVRWSLTSTGSHNFVTPVLFSDLVTVGSTFTTAVNTKGIQFGTTDGATSGVEYIASTTGSGTGYRINVDTNLLSFQKRSNSGTFSTGMSMSATGLVAIAPTMASDDAALTIFQQNALTGTSYGFYMTMNSTVSSTNYLQQNGNGECGFDILAVGSGDMFYRLGVNGGQYFALGIDRSDTNAFVMCESGTLGTNTFLKCDGNTYLSFPAPRIGFYSATPVAQQTGVAVTAGAIHAALVNLGLITA